MSEKSVGRTPNSNGGYKAQNSGRQQGNNKNGFDRRQGGKHAAQREKFVPSFKKREPTWKRIDAELKELLPKYDEIDANKITSFEDFPISGRTLEGLRDANYQTPTEIQRESIGIALKGYDLLGAAQTGSGKTLAFLIPVLECLYRLKWTKLDGLGVLVISPTRELAYQTFEVLKKVGKYHDFSAGLVIGGKDLKTESKIIDQTNIIICTPGRLLQHMDETVNFHCDNLKMLILDEADRILDLGFAQTMNSIVQNLPSARQTLLFSATQTKSIKDLARLSLRNPTYVSVHEHASQSTPKNLVQSYVVCEVYEKLSFLWSFIRNHLNQKIIVFFQSCKQTKFVFEAFTRMQTGMITLALYGTMNQLKRMQVYDEFCRKQHVILFATDLASRGLDFPSVNWVVQIDCPPDANTYIHRVGRTARYEKDGQALLVLTPYEKTEMVAELKASKIPIEEIKANMKRVVNIDSKLQSVCAGDVELKESAKRALMSYMRSLFLMSNKKIFNVESIDIPKLSASLGLVVAPRVRFLQRQLQSKETTIGNSKASEDEENSESEGLTSKKSSKLTPFQKKLALLNKARPEEKKASSDSEPLNFYGENDQEGDDGLFKVKRVDLDSTEGDSTATDGDLNPIDPRRKVKVKTKASVVKKLKKKNIKINEKVLFDEEGNRIAKGINVPKSIDITEELAKEFNDKRSKEGPSGIDIEEAKRLLQNEDQYDKQLYRDRIKRMHREKRLKEKELRRAKRQKKTEEGDDQVNVTLKGPESGDENNNNNDNDDDSDDEHDSDD